MTKIDRKKMPEWLILDMLYGGGTVIYIFSQLVILGYVSDAIFISMLSVATIFLNYRQLNLYRALINGENRLIFTQEEVSTDKMDGGVFEEEVNSIFTKKQDNIFAVIFAALFAVVMWQFDSWNQHKILKIAFSVYLFTANIPTGYAVIRILKYFYYNIKWIKNIKIEFGSQGGYSERFIKQICMKVLFTAVVYCAVSLSSILFTQIQINAIVVVYTIFAMLLVIISLSLTSILLNKRMNESNADMMEKIDKKVASIILDEVESERMDEQKVNKMKELIEMRGYIEKKQKGEVNFAKLASNFGLLFITVIPILLQWILDRFF